MSLLGRLLAAGKAALRELTVPQPVEAEPDDGEFVPAQNPITEETRQFLRERSPIEGAVVCTPWEPLPGSLFDRHRRANRDKL